MKKSKKNRTYGNTTNLEENLKYLNNIYKDNKEKIYNFCSECNRKYPLDITHCPECHEYLFPIPY